jgi:hypothetical protein
MSVGSNNIVSSDSIGFGLQNTVNASRSIVGGYASNLTGSHSIAIGWNNTVTTSSSAAFGVGNSASGYASFAINTSSALGNYSFAQGFSRAAGDYSTAVGSGANTNSNGQFSTSGGRLTYAGDSQYSVLTRGLSTNQVSSGGSYLFGSPINFENGTFSAGVDQISYITINIVISPREKIGTVTGLNIRDVYIAEYTLALVSSIVLGRNRIIGTPTLERTYSDANMSATNIVFNVNPATGLLETTVTPPTWTGGGTLEFRGTITYGASQLGLYN